MANTILRSNCKDIAFHVLGLFCLTLLMHKSSATQFRVGGNAQEWTVPDNTTGYSYNQWAEKNRFQIGDSLLFAYKPDQDSVLEVTKEKYDTCYTTEPIAKYSDAHTVLTFNHSGPHYFISGNKENCLKNEKLVVVVLADRSNHSSNTNQTITASPPSPGATDMGTVPSPGPAGQESPPSGTVEINPTPAPTGEHPPSAASSVLLSFAGSFGAFFASSLILVF